MDIKPLLNNRYAQLCQDLGHLQASLIDIQDRMEAVLAEIKALDNFSRIVAPKESTNATQPERK